MRFDWARIFPNGLEAMINFQKAVNKNRLDRKLIMLILTRVSQINGCAHCLDMHTKDAIAIGEDPRRLHVLAAWRGAPFYSEKERAALAWAEAVTLVSQTGVPDDVYAQVMQHFSPEEIMELTFVVIAINGWNRINIATRSNVGDYISPFKR